MNIYQFTATCDICGGEGAATYKTAAASWLADSTITHSDPRICRENLDRMREELRKQADKIKQLAQ